LRKEKVVATQVNGKECLGSRRAWCLNGVRKVTLFFMEKGRVMKSAIELASIGSRRAWC